MGHCRCGKMRGMDNAAPVRKDPGDGSPPGGGEPSDVPAGAVVWRFNRNCSISPRQLLHFYIALALFSLLVGLYCWMVGATLVMPFSGLEVLAVGAALLVYARHAADRERISLAPGAMVIEWESAGRLERAEFNPRWVRISVPDDRGLVEVSESGRRAFVGRYVRPEARERLARDLRRAILVNC